METTKRLVKPVLRDAERQIYEVPQDMRVAAVFDFNGAGDGIEAEFTSLGERQFALRHFPYSADVMALCEVSGLWLAYRPSCILAKANEQLADILGRGRQLQAMLSAAEPLKI